MKIIRLNKKYNKRPYKKDFRLRVVYTVRYECPCPCLEDWERDLNNMGLSKDSESVFVNGDSTIHVVIGSDSISVMFVRNILSADSRHEYVSNILGIFLGKDELKVNFVSVAHHNRYVLSDFIDNGKNRKAALKFFFETDFATEEELLYKEESLMALSKVTFSKNKDGLTTIDFTINVFKLYDGESHDFKKLYTVLDSTSYQYWRAAISKDVLKEMQEHEE